MHEVFNVTRNDVCNGMSPQIMICKWYAVAVSVWSWSSQLLHRRLDNVSTEEDDQGGRYNTGPLLSSMSHQRVCSCVTENSIEAVNNPSTEPKPINSSIEDIENVVLVTDSIGHCSVAISNVSRLLGLHWRKYRQLEIYCSGNLKEKCCFSCHNRFHRLSWNATSWAYRMGQKGTTFSTTTTY